MLFALRHLSWISGSQYCRLLGTENCIANFGCGDTGSENYKTHNSSLLQRACDEILEPWNAPWQAIIIECSDTASRLFHRLKHSRDSDYFPSSNILKSFSCLNIPKGSPVSFQEKKFNTKHAELVFGTSILLFMWTKLCMLERPSTCSGLLDRSCLSTRYYVG